MVGLGVHGAGALTWERLPPRHADLATADSFAVDDMG
jgi:hypothetical protein